MPLSSLLWQSSAKGSLKPRFQPCVSVLKLCFHPKSPPEVSRNTNCLEQGRWPRYRGQRRAARVYVRGGGRAELQYVAGLFLSVVIS